MPTTEVISAMVGVQEIFIRRRRRQLLISLGGGAWFLVLVLAVLVLGIESGYQLGSSGLQLSMPKHKRQNWWKVILLNPNLRKPYHQLFFDWHTESVHSHWVQRGGSTVNHTSDYEARVELIARYSV